MASKKGAIERKYLKNRRKRHIGQGIRDIYGVW
jgi:hypothetical protein